MCVLVVFVICGMQVHVLFIICNSVNGVATDYPSSLAAVLPVQFNASVVLGQ